MNHESIEVLFEDNHLLVMNKPNLVPTMGAKSGVESFLDRAKSYIKTKYNKPGNVYLGVVSRLDSFVSGVIIFARTSKSAARLTKQFAEREVKKTYWAIVEKPLHSESGELVDWVFKNDSLKKMQVGDKGHRNCKKAILQYSEIGQHGSRRLLEIRPLTGRKHQIRVQLSENGSPIVGDKKYKANSTLAEGICLHSRCLQIQHPISREKMHFESNPPKWWNLQKFSMRNSI